MALLQHPINAISLALGLLFGLAGLPHILIRFFTVNNAIEAPKSVLYATGFVGFFLNVILLMGVCSMVIVGTNPAFFEGGKIVGGGNMVAMHLAKAVGCDLLLGFLASVAFATILAVVSGLALAGASAISRDFYAREKKRHRVRSAGNQGFQNGVVRYRHDRRGARPSPLKSRMWPSWRRWPSVLRRPATSRCCSCRCTGKT